MCMCACVYACVVYVLLYVVSTYKWYCYKVVIKYQYKNTGYHLKSHQSKIPSSLTVEILTELSLDLDGNFYINKNNAWQIGYIVFGHIHFIMLSLYGNGFKICIILLCLLLMTTVFHLLMYEDKYNKPFIDECLVFPIISYSHDKYFDTFVFNLWE